MDDRMPGWSRFLSYVLRHEPERIGLTLDPAGWADVDTLVRLANREGFTRDALLEIVAADPKGRYQLSPDGTRIRAAYGHSLPVDLGLQPAAPPEHLYHGTARESVEGIREHGLHPGRRRYVHLSAREATAREVGSRHGRPVVLRVKSRVLYIEGKEFLRAGNEVWLVDEVPPKYLETVEPPKPTPPAPKPRRKGPPRRPGGPRGPRGPRPAGGAGH
jgi:putative RNA 2'-phosphotransferase